MHPGGERLVCLRDDVYRGSWLPDVVVRDREAVLSPPWSIHCGAGTGAYRSRDPATGANPAFLNPLTGKTSKAHGHTITLGGCWWGWSCLG